MIEVLWLMALVVATEAITEIIVDSEIMEPVRSFIFLKSLTSSEPAVSTVQPWAFIHRLIHCGYCASVWVAMAAAMLAPWVVGYWVLNWLVMVFVIHRLSNFFHIVLQIIKKGRVRTYDLEIKRVTSDGSSR